MGREGSPFLCALCSEGLRHLASLATLDLASVRPASPSALVCLCAGVMGVLAKVAPFGLEPFAAALHVLQRDKHAGIALAQSFFHFPFVALELAFNDPLERL